MKFRIKRFDGVRSWYDAFDVKVRPHMSVLDGLFQIQDELDSTLAFRYSCRGGVCGSSAMLINKKHRLACRTQLDEIAGEQVISPLPYGPVVRPAIKTGDHVLIEPLPNLPVIKDLIVDMDRFFKYYKDIRPWIEDRGPHLLQERLMSQADIKKIDRYAACILCGLCYGACPVASRDKEFLGPAALAKAWRFYADSRNTGIEEILRRVDLKRGIWACDEVYRCVEVCPKQVPPTNAITGFMRRAIIHRLKTIIR